MQLYQKIYAHKKHMDSELLNVLITHASSGFHSSLLYNHTFHNKISDATFHACSLYEILVHVKSFLYNHSLDMDEEQIHELPLCAFSGT
jgi:hypothetical protein